jgi:hypothetical protein
MEWVEQKGKHGGRGTRRQLLNQARRLVILGTMVRGSFVRRPPATPCFRFNQGPWVRSNYPRRGAGAVAGVRYEY